MPYQQYINPAVVGFDQVIIEDLERMMRDHAQVRVRVDPLVEEDLVPQEDAKLKKKNQ